ncbi:MULTISPECIES: hypothetical protein [Rhizobium]|uniref:hypothetical protein n=1 Tax=Rhizobium TaxID=379 RepID=UPI00047F69E2|nr:MULTISPECIES: hypothetical protein [Rhizobium]NEH37901.1 hypothetical protein [Rhizobium ruizarguesonis]TBC80946.1 hypothetical protein ELH30_24570 [Rhizobium ruizarguesonis]WFT85984.1 hypothetical protein QA638_24395 [Rhizobium leguminosarum]
MSFLPYTIEEQAAAMSAAWPLFAQRRFRAEAIIWRGMLKPHSRPYEVEIAYSMDMVLDGPEVRVLSPGLTRLPGNPEGSIPHVYNRDNDPVLCLFDPAREQWSGWRLVSETTVPWAIDWLACYEFWLMTGVWDGGGRHPPSNGRRINVENRP